MGRDWDGIDGTGLELEWDGGSEQKQNKLCMLGRGTTTYYNLQNLEQKMNRS